MREHDAIGQPPGGQRALEVFLEAETGVAQGQNPQLLLPADAPVPAKDAAGDRVARGETFRGELPRLPAQVFGGIVPIRHPALSPDPHTRRRQVLGSRDWCTTAITSIHLGRIR